MTVDIDDKRFFLQTLNDIEHKLKIGDSYNIIRSAGMIRQLLLDKEPLALKINREYKTPIEFLIHDNTNTFKDIRDNEEPNETFFSEWHILTPILTSHMKKLKLSEFLKVVVVRHCKHEYTVKDIIQYTSTFLGGIHSFNPSREDEISFTKMQMTMNDLNMNLICLASISYVTLEALEPLKKRLK